MTTPSVPGVGDLLMVGPRLLDRSRSQLALVRSLLGYLPCISGPEDPADDAAPSTAVTEERVDVLSVLADETVDEDLPPSVRSRLRSDTSDPALEPTPSEPAPVQTTRVPDQDELAIPDYDGLAASQVVPKLATLDTNELAAIGEYERAHRARRTILNRVSQLQKG